MNKAKKISVLISGRGSNLKSLIDHQGTYDITHVVSDRGDAGGLNLAREAGIPSTIVSRNEFGSIADFKSAILRTVQTSKPDLVALAGFMVLLPPEFIDAFNGRLLNVHPSLLPRFPGLDTHQRALAAGDTRHGCTVHFVDHGVDTGPLIAQSSVAITPGDTSDTLAARVLQREHELYPAMVSLVATGDIILDGRKVHYSDRAMSESRRIGCSLFFKRTV